MTPAGGWEGLTECLEQLTFLGQPNCTKNVKYAMPSSKLALTVLLSLRIRSQLMTLHS